MIIMAELKTGGGGLAAEIKKPEAVKPVVPVGALMRLERSKAVISKSSNQAQWIPEDAAEFYDVITGEKEEV